MMKEFFTWLDRPPVLSAAAKWARLLSILMGIAALAGIGVFLFAVWPVMAGRPGMALLYLLDEMDDEIGAIFMLIVGSGICGYVSHLLRRRNRRAQDTPLLPQE